MYTAMWNQQVRSKVAVQQLNLHSVLEMRYNAYIEGNGMDNDKIKRDFEDLYEAMHGKTLREKDRVIDAVCRLCRDHEKRGFADGIGLGLRLAQEVKLP